MTESVDFAKADDAANVDILTEPQDDRKKELRQIALAMFEDITLVVRNAQGNIVGGLPMAECRVCSSIVRPRASSLLPHMRRHLRGM